MAELTLIKWRDIPMQVVVRGDAGGSARRLLPDRFQEAVDAAAMVAGLIGSDDYTEQMQMDRREVGDDLEAEAQAVEDAVLAEWTEDALKVAIRAAATRAVPTSPAARTPCALPQRFDLVKPS